MPDFHEGLFILLAHLFLTLGATLTECGNNLLRLIQERQEQGRLAQARSPAELVTLTQSTQTIRFAESSATSTRASTPETETTFATIHNLEPRTPTKIPLRRYFRPDGTCGHVCHDIQQPRLRYCPDCREEPPQHHSRV